MAADVLPWDTTRPYRTRDDIGQDFFNAGCPPGYYAQIVPKGSGTDYGNPISDLV